MFIANCPESGIVGDVEVVNNKLTILDDRLFASIENKMNTSSSVKKDAQEDKFTIVDDKLAIRDN